MKGITPQHAPKLRVILHSLDNAAEPEDLNSPGYALHPLSGTRRGDWSITVTKNWRITFRFTGHDVELLDYEDYH